jgi:hypothetical protein
MIYSAKVLEIHYNICSVEADTEAEARQKFLSSVISSDDCLGSGYVSTVAIVEVQENPDHDADFESIVDSTNCLKLINTGAIERIDELKHGSEYDPDGVHRYLTPNKWQGLRGFLAGLKDELEGTID